MYAQPTNLNQYLQERNKKFFRGHSEVIHPLYEQEYKNAVESITTFLNLSILRKAHYLRSKKLYELTSEKCYKNNNYTYSEAETCQEVVFDRDPILNNINNFKKEVEVKIQDNYEKQVKYADKKEFEENHRSFLQRLHNVDRFTYYLLAKKLFI